MPSTTPAKTTSSISDDRPRRTDNAATPEDAPLSLLTGSAFLGRESAFLGREGAFLGGHFRELGQEVEQPNQGEGGLG